MPFVKETMNSVRTFLTDHRGFFIAASLVAGVYIICKVFGEKKATGATFVDIYNLVDTIDLNDPLDEEELRILTTIGEIIGQDGDQSATLEPVDAARILILTTLVELMVTGDDGRHVHFDPLYVDEIPMMMRILVTLLIGGMVCLQWILKISRI